MPAKRRPDGSIEAVPSELISSDKQPDANQGVEPTAPANKSDRPRPETPEGGSYAAKTVLGTARRPVQSGKPVEARTRIYRPGQQKPSPAASTSTPTAIPTATSATAMDDPPVGWLVVVAGPGQGSVATIGNGVNSIGRDASERLSLDFGDEMISRTGHATLTYDPRGKKFYIQHGGGTNLTYVNDQPVLAPQELPPGTQIQIGNTILRFVPLCDEHFDWDEAGN